MRLSRVTAAVRIKMRIDRNTSTMLKMAQLSKDLKRLKESMSQEEYADYIRRIA